MSRLEQCRSSPATLRAAASDGARDISPGQDSEAGRARKGAGLLLALASVGLCAHVLLGAESETAGTRVEIEDPPGDVQGHGDHPGKDVVRVALEGDGEQLHIDVTTSDTIAEYLDGHMAGDVIVLQIDTDGDPETGGALMFGRKPGFEMRVAVRVCITTEGGWTCIGSLGGPPTGFFATTDIGRYADGASSASGIHPPGWEYPRVPLEGNRFEVSVPYSELGVEPGETIRVAVLEADASDHATEYSPDVLLKLR